MNLFINFIVAAVFAGTPLLFGTLVEWSLCRANSVRRTKLVPGLALSGML